MKAGITFEEEGGISSSLERANEPISVKLEVESASACGKLYPVGLIAASLQSILPVCGAGLMHTGGISCTLTFTSDSAPLPEPYLEIEPEVLWLTDWGGFNNVYSNTDWNIN